MKSHVTLMTEGRPVRLIVAFSLPLMLGNIFQQLYSVADSMIVGKTLGVAALAALGASTWPSWFFLGMVLGLSQGISIILAYSFGQGDVAKLRRSYGNAIVVSTAFSVVLLVLGELSATEILALLHTPEELMPDALSYLRITYFGIPVIMCVCLPVLYLLYVFRSSTQGLGNTFLPMVSAFAEMVMRIASALILARIIGETGLFIAEVAAWAGATVVLIFSYIYTIRKLERQNGYSIMQ